MESNMDSLVRQFNNLPRTPKIPAGTADNHWHFAIQHVPLDPPGDLLHLVNTESSFNHCEGPADIPDNGRIADRAFVVLRLLLRSFVTSMGEKSFERWMPPYGPWTWGTSDKELAKALETMMRTVGLRSELCRVYTGPHETIKIAKAEWVRVLGKVMKMVGPPQRCVLCLDRLNPTGTLQLCSGCRKVHYCSLVCQKAHWPMHQEDCIGPMWAAFDRQPAGPGTRPLPVSAVKYYTTIARHGPAAQALAHKIGLRLPSPGSNLQNIRAPIRRLVVTGRDTPGNRAMFFGDDDEDYVQLVYRAARIELLLPAPPGSNLYVQTANEKLDEGCPFRAPQKATAFEEKELGKIRGMQELIKRHMGSRKLSSHTDDDMNQIIQRHYSHNRVKAIPRYVNALNSLCLDKNTSAGASRYMPERTPRADNSRSAPEVQRNDPMPGRAPRTPEAQRNESTPGRAPRTPEVQRNDLRPDRAPRPYNSQPAPEVQRNDPVPGRAPRASEARPKESTPSHSSRVGNSRSTPEVKRNESTPSHSSRAGNKRSAPEAHRKESASVQSSKTGTSRAVPEAHRKESVSVQSSRTGTSRSVPEAHRNESTAGQSSRTGNIRSILEARRNESTAGQSSTAGSSRYVPEVYRNESTAGHSSTAGSSRYVPEVQRNDSTPGRAPRAPEVQRNESTRRRVHRAGSRCSSPEVRRNESTRRHAHRSSNRRPSPEVPRNESTHRRTLRSGNGRSSPEVHESTRRRDHRSGNGRSSPEAQRNEYMPGRAPRAGHSGSAPSQSTEYVPGHAPRGGDRRFPPEVYYDEFAYNEFFFEEAYNYYMPGCAPRSWNWRSSPDIRYSEFYFEEEYNCHMPWCPHSANGPDLRYSEFFYEEEYGAFNGAARATGSYQRAESSIPNIYAYVPRNSRATPSTLFPEQRLHRREFPRFVHVSDANSFLIYTDGICYSEGQRNSMAGWGFAFREPDMASDIIGAVSGRLEDRGPSGESYQPAAHRAQLRAVIAALQFRIWYSEGWKNLVIATDSEYVVRGATEWAAEWARHGWVTANRIPVVDRDLWQLLIEVIERHRDGGMDVCFWLIARESNARAIRAADDGARHHRESHFTGLTRF